MKRRLIFGSKLKVTKPADFNNLLKEYTDRLEQQIANENQFFRLMADAMPQIVWTARANGTIEYFNQRWYEYTGLSGKQSLTTAWRVKVIHADDRATTKQKWEEAVRNGEPFEIEYRLQEHSTKKYRWFLGRATPAIDDSGKVIKWFGTCTDIDEHKRNQEKKDEFIAVASHELKTPVTSIKMYAQFLERHFKKTEDEHAAGHMVRINEQLDRLGALIHGLLDVTRVESGQLVLNLSDFKIDQLVQDTANSIQPLSRKHRLIVKGKSNLVVHGDKERVAQVLTNLINNAVKYSPKSDRVIISINSSKTEVTVCVKDFGVGISKEDLPRIFTRFYRLKKSDPSVHSGLGLGLYVSNEIVKRLSGRISVESTLGKGSCFCFSLPLK